MRRQKLPSYRLHKASGRAVVTLGGKDYYLGPHQSRVSYQEYDRLVAEWLARGRRAPGEDDELLATVNDVILGYWTFAEDYYRKDGKPTTELVHLKRILKVLRRLYGETKAADFGPLALKACREVFLEQGGSRQKVNQNVQRIRRVFRWATENEYVPGDVYHSLQAVAGLRRGRTSAKENKKVRPAPLEHVEAVLPHVAAEVAAMIRLQLLTGMRPGEVVIMRGGDIDRKLEPWVYRPFRHKTEHHDLDREVMLGPRAQAVLRPFLLKAGDGFLFSPERAEEERHRRRRAQRRSPMTPSQRRRRKKRDRRRAPRDIYDTQSYRRAIHRVCEREGIPKWTPAQLRHNAATELRREFGIEVARVVLGHRSAATTEIYAEIDRTKASEAMSRIG